MAGGAVSAVDVAGEHGHSYPANSEAEVSEKRFVAWMICFAYGWLGSSMLGSGFAWDDPLMVFLGTIATGVCLFYFWGIQRYPEQQ
jgi:hypothetical protein